MIEEVVTFNRDVLGIEQRDLEPLSEGEWRWLEAALKEEVQEADEAFEQQDVVGMVDGLIDSIYFAIGGMYRMGLTEEQIKLCFLAVHEKNMMKKKGVKETRPNDGSVADAVKPAGFVDPKTVIHHILFGEIVDSYGDRG